MDFLSCSRNDVSSRLVHFTVVYYRYTALFRRYAVELAVGLYHPTLRKPGDTRHYLPQKGMYRYVTSANYFGEILEWAGWAILTCSLSGLVFLWWTIANLVPRANAIWCLLPLKNSETQWENGNECPLSFIRDAFHHDLCMT